MRLSSEIWFNILFFFISFLSTYSFREYGADIAPFSAYGLYLLLIVFLFFALKWIVQRQLKIVHDSNIKVNLLILTFIPAFFSIFSSQSSFGSLRWSILQMTMMFSAIGIVTASQMFPLNLAYNGIFKGIIRFSFVLAFFAFISLFTEVMFDPIKIPQADSFRISGWLYSPNVFVNIIGIGVFLSYLLSVRKQGKFYYFSFLFLIIALFMSGSRGGFYSFIIAFFYYLILTKKLAINKNLLKRVLGILPAIALLILGLYFLLVWIKADLTDLRFFSDELRIEEDERFDIWQNIAAKWSNGSFFEKSFGFGRETVGKLSSSASHNSIIDMVVDYGIVYVFVFFLILTSILYKSQLIYKKTKDETIAIALTIILFLIFRSFTIYAIIGLNYETFIFYLFIMVLNNLIYTKENKQSVVRQ